MSEVVDLRSDTITKPDDEMRAVIAAAEVGDDVFGEDPSVAKLQKQVAELLDKEAALFVPSGTMGNLIAVLCHCKERGSEIILGDQSHIFLYEQGGVSQFGGVHPRTVPNLPNGTFSLEEMKKAIRPSDFHQPVTRLVCIENTHNMAGGKVLPINWLSELGAMCSKLGLPLHMDGARLLNAAVALKVPPSELTKYCQSVNMCFSKGLGAPVGSMLAGSRNFIARAIRVRKALGGGMRQCGILAAASSLALARYQKTLSTDHEHAKAIAEVVKGCNSNAVTTNVDEVDTNIVMLTCNTDKIKPEELANQLWQTKNESDISVKSFAVNEKQVRLVIHSNITREAVDKACKKIFSVITNIDKDK